MGILDKLFKKEPSFEALFKRLDSENKHYNLESKFENELLEMSDDQKTLLLTDIIQDFTNNYISNQYNKRISNYNRVASFLTKRKILFGEHSTKLLQAILENFKAMIKTNQKNPMSYNYSFIFAVKPILTNIVRFHKFEKAEDRALIKEIALELDQFGPYHNNTEPKKLADKIDDLFKDGTTDKKVKPTYFLGNDDLKTFANAKIDSLKEGQKETCFQIISLAQKTSGSKPTAKFLDESKGLIEQFGNEAFKAFSQDIFEFIIGFKEKKHTHVNNYNGQEYTYDTYEFLVPINLDVVKSLVWMNSKFYDNKTLVTLGKLAERCFKKIPGVGPASAGLGNACIYTLYASKGLDGIAQLSKLKLRIKQPSTITLIDKYIAEVATKLGISTTEVEDLAVDDFKLKDKKLEVVFDDYKAVLELTGIGKSTLKWFKADGKEQKTVPQFVKDKYADKLKKLKDKQKQIDQTTSVQKERMDRMLRTDRAVSLDYFKNNYLNHGLLSFVINHVIFQFKNGTENKLAIKINQKWIDLDYKEVDIDRYNEVTLWHPATSSTEEVKQWRQFLMDAQIQQPFKQAYREIYLLTDAEINTRTYSNRMASHILKQHQYVTLAKGRNWKARLIGSWDGGDDDIAELYLPDYKIKVQYWVNALDADNQWNDTGIWNYVTTDQVRFINSETEEVMQLVDVPIIAFSEAMRDVDLFVGVASVGNDPNWQDSGGLPAHRDYWQSYSFGDLSQLAINRKEILETLIPRLKIAPVAHIADKFLVVKGKLRTYKIHIGSTNILMEPNDQYLCIVMDRSKKNEAENVFLPFEGDNGLSIIISKAFLLANDDKITDTTITSQINR